jgi:hypothetical protein
MLEPNSKEQEVTRPPIHCPHKLDFVYELTGSGKQPVTPYHNREGHKTIQGI